MQLMAQNPSFLQRNAVFLYIQEYGDVREALMKKNSFGHCPNYLSLPRPPFLDVKNDFLMRITEPSNDDNNNDGSDNCGYNFVTFDDFGVKNEQKVSHNMISMSKYKGQHGGKKG